MDKPLADMTPDELRAGIDGGQKVLDDSQASDSDKVAAFTLMTRMHRELLTRGAST